MFNINFRSFDYTRDLERLYTYMMNEENQILFSHAFQIHNLPMFERWISEKFAKNDYHDFFMIENSAKKTIGFTFSYDFLVMMHTANIHYVYTKNFKIMVLVQLPE